MLELQLGHQPGMVEEVIKSIIQKDACKENRILFSLRHGNDSVRLVLWSQVKNS